MLDMVVSSDSVEGSSSPPTSSLHVVSPFPPSPTQCVVGGRGAERVLFTGLEPIQEIYKCSLSFSIGFPWLRPKWGRTNRTTVESFFSAVRWE